MTRLDPGLWERAARLYDAQRFLERRALRGLAEMLADEGALSGSLLDAGTGTGAMLGTITVAPWCGLSAPLGGLSRRAGDSSGPLAGLRVIDPRPDLIAAGYELRRAWTARRGYPSLCLIARAA